MNESELRKKFLDFFEKHGHKVIKSSSVVPFDDNSLLFVNSGMVQFKKIFTSEIDETSEMGKLKRVCTIQRCIRAGGKHNDLDDVGKDTYHHTYFEMLGNWSFGDYFKEKAIDLAYDFLINILKLPKERIYVTYFKGADDFKCDLETKEIWKKYFPEEKILPFGMKENFWEMGSEGPCGPCTEIHFDRIGNRNAAHLVNKDDPMVIEIWNIVFMEFFRNKNGFSFLKKKCVDTGMGFERILSILNNVDSNYKTTLFSNVFDFMSKKFNLPKYNEDTGGINLENQIKNLDINNDKITQKQINMAYRIVVDHCRTITVCLHDGVTFSSDGRGYVLRRIIRRAIRYADDFLKIEKGGISLICEFLSIPMNLKLDSKHIEMINSEEELFLRTLKKGKEYFDKMSKNGKLSGKDIFILHDTYGFPVDLTQILSNEKNISIDMEGYNIHKQEAISKSRMKKNDEFKVNIDDLKVYPHTNDTFKYTDLEIWSKTLCFILEDTILNVNQILNYKNISVVFDKTCFYSEKGGQVGDQGKIEFYDKNKSKILGELEVIDTRYIGKYVLHSGIMNGMISENAKLIVDKEKREKIQANHTATHILNYILRKKYNCEQMGSFLNHEKLRFDFTNVEINLREVENEVNELIKKKLDVLIEEKDINDVKNAIKLKNEQYPSKVRVVNICSNLEYEDSNYENLNSKDKVNMGEKILTSELCGGTHVSNTKEIKAFIVTGFNSISNSAKRITAVTGDFALKLKDRSELVISDLKNGKINDIPNDISFLAREKMKNIYENIEKQKRNEWKEKISLQKKKLQMISDNSFIYKMQICSDKILKDMNLLASVVPKEKKFLIYYYIESLFYFFIRGYEISDKIHKFGAVRMGGKGFICGTVENFKNVEELIKFLKPS